MSKSKLEELRSILNALQPELVDIQQNEVVPGEEILIEYYNLLFSDEERSCSIQLYDPEDHVKCMFQWDGANLFSLHRPELNQLSNMILHWVVKKIVPSKMQVLFQSLEIGMVASYYEKGEGVKGEFIHSWNKEEEFYQWCLSEFNTPKYKAYLQLIKILRAEGLDEQFRAGSSLEALVLSRSKRYGLDMNSSYIKFYFPLDGGLQVNYYFENPKTDIQNYDPEDISSGSGINQSPFHPHEKSILTELRYTDELKALIERLLQEEIK